MQTEEVLRTVVVGYDNFDLIMTIVKRFQKKAIQINTSQFRQPLDEDIQHIKDLCKDYSYVNSEGLQKLLLCDFDTARKITVWIRKFLNKYSGTDSEKTDIVYMIMSCCDKVKDIFDMEDPALLLVGSIDEKMSILIDLLYDIEYEVMVIDMNEEGKNCFNRPHVLMNGEKKTLNIEVYKQEIEKDKLQELLDSRGKIIVEYLGVLEDKAQYNNILFEFRNKLEDRVIFLNSYTSYPTQSETNSYGQSGGSAKLKKTMKSLMVGADTSLVDADMYIEKVLKRYSETTRKDIEVIIGGWLIRYVKPMEDLIREGKEITVLIFGGISKDMKYFIFWLAKAGFSVVHFAPNMKWMIHGLPRICIGETSDEITAYPVKLLKVKIQTSASKAEEEMTSLMFTDTGMYRDRQFKNMENLELKTTYDEAKLLWSQETRFRTGFSTQNDKVTVPNLFIKIKGIEEGKRYTQMLREFKTDYTLTFSFPMFKQELKTCNTSVEEIPKQLWYPYSYVDVAVQDLILKTMKKVIDELPSWDISGTITPQEIVGVLITLKEKELQLLQSFDFTKQPPKIIIDDVTTVMAEKADAIRLMFYHLAGFDIAILTPTGYLNIENYINPSVFETYVIGKLVFDQTELRRGLTLAEKINRFLKKEK